MLKVGDYLENVGTIVEIFEDGYAVSNLVSHDPIGQTVTEYVTFVKENV